MTQKADYQRIVEVYNEQGRAAASKFIVSEFNMGNPSRVIKQIKRSPKFHYDEAADRFIDADDTTVDAVFMNLDELCGAQNRHQNSPRASEKAGMTVDVLVKQLLEERLLQISAYVQMNQSTKTVLIDKTSLIADGYKVQIH